MQSAPNIDDPTGGAALIADRGGYRCCACIGRDPGLDAGAGTQQYSWSRGEVWSSRWPVKPEVAGSNPVGTAVG